MDLQHSNKNISLGKGGKWKTRGSLRGEERGDGFEAEEKRSQVGGGRYAGREGGKSQEEGERRKEECTG